MTARLEITPDITPDPNATPRVDIVEGANGGVKVDPALTPAPVEKSTEGERPAWLPAKYKTIDAFVKAHGELESKLGTPKEPAVTPVAVTAEAATKAGIDLPALDKEFSEKGELSAETLKSLADKGFDKASVDSYIAGQSAIAEKLVTDLQAVAGGKEAFTATLEWAKANLSAEDKAAYNKAIDTGDLGVAKLALQGVVAQYAEANGTEPNLIDGGEGARTTGVEPYASNAQVIADMRTQKYKTDPAFRKQVEARLAVTP